jgi:multimeric flavodoxin WrbA
MIYLTPVTFGGYSSELKKAIDRFACSMLLPFFTKIDGEVHHKARYQHLPSLIGIGILPGPEEESGQIFAKLVERNAINIHSPSVQSAVYYPSQDRGQIVEGLRSILRNL